VEHSGLSGESFIASKQKLGVGVLKNKQQLVHALEKAPGQELAEKAKQEAASVALQKTKALIEEQAGKVVLPAGPEQFAAFMASVQDAGAACAAPFSSFTGSARCDKSWGFGGNAPKVDGRTQAVSWK
jgi:hypothetical protein